VKRPFVSMALCIVLVVLMSIGGVCRLAAAAEAVPVVKIGAIFPLTGAAAATRSEAEVCCGSSGGDHQWRLS